MPPVRFGVRADVVPASECGDVLGKDEPQVVERWLHPAAFEAGHPAGMGGLQRLEELADLPAVALRVRLRGGAEMGADGPAVSSGRTNPDVSACAARMARSSSAA